MKGLLAAPRRVLAVGAFAAVAIVVAAGYGYAAITATNNTYTGCLRAGLISNVAIGTEPASACARSAVQISWSQTGPQGQPGQEGTNGTDGVSVNSEAEPAGANCADGGSKFTAANGITYACNGAKGDKGDPGPANLAALQGSPCTYNGQPSKLDVSVDSTSGAISMTCIPVYGVTAMIDGGMMTMAYIRDDTVDITHRVHDFGGPFSAFIPRGHNVRVTFESGTQSNGGGSPFTYTCPESPPQSADAVEASDGGTFYHGSCLFGPLSGPTTVYAAFN